MFDSKISTYPKTLPSGFATPNKPNKLFVFSKVIIQNNKTIIKGKEPIGILSLTILDSVKPGFVSPKPELVFVPELTFAFETTLTIIYINTHL